MPVSAPFSLSIVEIKTKKRAADAHAPAAHKKNTRTLNKY